MDRRKISCLPWSISFKKRRKSSVSFCSVDQEWVWQSKQLITETKRPSPGNDKGFRAIALIPVIEGTAVDIVTENAVRPSQSGKSRLI